MVSFTGNSLSITPAPLTVAASHQSKVYGSADPTLTYTASGFQFSDSAATALGGTLSRAAGESVAGSSYNHYAGDAGGQQQLHGQLHRQHPEHYPGPLTVAASHQTKVYGSADPALTYAPTASSSPRAPPLS